MVELAVHFFNAFFMACSLVPPCLCAKAFSNPPWLSQPHTASHHSICGHADAPPELLHLAGQELILLHAVTQPVQGRGEVDDRSTDQGHRQN